MLGETGATRHVPPCLPITADCSCRHARRATRSASPNPDCRRKEQSSARPVAVFRSSWRGNMVVLRSTPVKVCALRKFFFWTTRNSLYIDQHPNTTKLLHLPRRLVIKLEPSSTLKRRTTKGTSCRCQRTQSEADKGSVDNTDDINLQLWSSRASSLANCRASGSTNNRDGRDQWGEKLGCRCEGSITELNTEKSSPLNLGSDIGGGLNCLQRIHPSGKKKAKTTWIAILSWSAMKKLDPFFTAAELRHR
jgi:hypothetical protein